MPATLNPNGPYGDANGIQIPTAATCKLSMFRDDTLLSIGSGFIIDNEQSYFLVTALHNFTGRNFFTGKCIDSSSLATPNKYIASVYLRVPGAEIFHPFDIKAPIFINAEPLFYYDLTKTGGDVAIVEIPKEKSQPELISMHEAAQSDWTAFAGLNVSALGYPSNIDVARTPIWKAVSLASEPSRQVNGNRITLVDGLTYKGMSGGPVFINQSQGFTNHKKYLLNKELSMKLLGVYGGRYEIDSEKSYTLGFYWPFEIVNEIIKERRQLGEIDCY